MVDSFASNAADPDHQIHLQIDEDLRNAQRVLAELEATHAGDPNAKVRTQTQRALDRPRREILYPRVTAVKEPNPWLMPLVRRLLWNQDRGDAGSAWVEMLVEMIQRVMIRVREVTEADFIELVDAAEALRPHLRFLGPMGTYACALEMTAPLSAAVLGCVRRLLRYREPPAGNRDHREGLLWPLFRSPLAQDAADMSWKARVRREVAAMNPPLAAGWLAALNTEPRTSRAAIQRLGSEQLEAGSRRWIGILREMPEPVIGPDDAFVFWRVIELCEQVEGRACDELLYEVARTPWTREPEHRWMYHYLELLKKRPQASAFTCLEALAMNPITASQDVVRQYEAHLAVFGSEATEESPVGVDGFPLDSDPSLAVQHRRIDQLLRMAATAASKGPYVDPVIAARLAYFRSMNQDDLSPSQRTAKQMWERQMTEPQPWFPVSPEVREAHEVMVAAMTEEFSADPANLNRAVTARAEWIRRHQNEYSAGVRQLWNEWLHGLGCDDGLVGKSLAKVDDLELQSLIRAIKARGASSKVFELCQKYVAKNGWHIDLVEPFRQFIPALGVPCNQTENARAEWFLWFENVAPIDLSACWSYRIKQDLRAMPAKQAAAWRALLDNPTFMITGKPSAKWRKAAEKAFPPVGVAEFRRRFAGWFAPFAAGEPMRITITGRNMLRMLIWYVLLAKDEAVDQTLLGFASARWKTKEFAKRVAQAEMAFSYVLSERQPKTALPILEGLVESGQAFKDSMTHKIYLGLCADQKRRPVEAIPLPTKPVKAPAPNPVLGKLTTDEFQRMTQKLEDPRPSNPGARGK